MGIFDLLLYLAIGALAGWLAGQIMKGRGFGLLGNVVVGIVGALLGGVVFAILGITAYGILGSITMSTVGAIVLLWIVGVIRRT